jgi:type IV secretory pathway VirB2 component (pilin)
MRRQEEREGRSGLVEVAVLVLAMLPAAAGAGSPGGAPLVSFAQSVVEFLTSTLGPLVIIIGVCVGALCWAVGARDGLQRAVYAILGGVLLFSAGAIVDFISRTVR